MAKTANNTPETGGEDTAVKQQVTPIVTTSAKKDLPKHEFDLAVGDAVVALKADNTQQVKVKMQDWQSTYEPSGSWDLIDSRTSIDEKKSS